MKSQYPLSEQGYIQQLSIDCVIFGYQDKKLKVLVPKLNFKGEFFALPSGFVYQDEDIDDAARRILRDRTGIQDVYLEQFNVTGKANRSSKVFLDRLIEQNPELIAANVQKLNETVSGIGDYDWFTRRFISIGYYALVDINQVTAQKTDLDESIQWYDLDNLPSMIMDHNQIIGDALETFKLTLDQKANAFHLLEETFTMKDVQELYETIFEKQYARNNFQKKILEMNALERMEKKFTGAANKAPYLYRLPKRE
ncbi:NrtR DNA-binding winged helix domain-containing protein [Dyadobacter sp. NIV53]|uniref:NUDIX hydrolase n=1 Tax=Dyadobacter sp. NIV53 TaxID=2861765 RepID=UPI001C880190|nr:NUDIX domain-containing protein [Dyadobacter sp. NIV53]